MIFNEIYGVYFNTVSKILKEASNEPISDKDIRDIVEENAFSESILSIPEKIAYDGSWGLLDEDSMSILNNRPQFPITRLEKRWLKALLQDKRISLFEPDIRGLEDVKPLYDEDFFVYYDKFVDGDPYDSEDYRKNFKTILNAIKKEACLKVSYPTRKRGNIKESICKPLNMEYSQRDDKFRLIVRKENGIAFLNLVKIVDCSIVDEKDINKRIFTNIIANENNSEVYLDKDNSLKKDCIYRKKEVTFILNDERMTLERFMHQFSFFEKKIERLDDNKYKVTIIYENDDETDVVIKIMSFGPTIKVISPNSFVKEIKKRLYKQKRLLE